MEQANHTIDGWIENRKNIVEEHLPLYDSLSRDILSQLHSQGVSVQFEQTDEQEHLEENNEDMAKATRIIHELAEYCHTLSMDSMEAQLLFSKVNEMNKVLFGSDYMYPLQEDSEENK